MNGKPGPYHEDFSDDCPECHGPPVGTIVGAERWPNSHAHPDCWEQPWSGTILARNDLRAWRNTLAFPRPEMLVQANVDRHVNNCLADGLLRDKVPVLWDFSSEQKVYWEPLKSVRLYADDVDVWYKARQAARHRYQGDDHGTPPPAPQD